MRPEQTGDYRITCQSCPFYVEGPVLVAAAAEFAREEMVKAWNRRVG
jgi:hypothetical protein